MTAAGAFEYTVGDLATELAQHYLKATSTICGHTSHTHAEFFKRASRLADELAADGAGSGDRLLEFRNGVARAVAYPVPPGQRKPATGGLLPVLGGGRLGAASRVRQNE